MVTRGVPLWSKTSAANASSDPEVNWAEGQPPSSVNNSARAMMGGIAKWRDDLYGLATGGSATAYSVTTNSTYASAAAMADAIFTIIPHATSGANPTLTVDGLTARFIRVSTGVSVPSGALVDGSPYLVKYVHGTTEFIVLGAVGKNSVGSIDIVGGTALTAPNPNDSLPIYDLSATANKKITLEDFLKVINGLTALTTPSPSTDSTVVYDVSAGVAKKVLLQNFPSAMPRGYISGIQLGWVNADDISFSSGRCRDSTNTVDINCVAMTKQLDANWAAGTNHGMRQSAGIANTTYHLFAISKADGTQDYFAATATDPTSQLPNDYIYYRRVGSIIRAGGAILEFTQRGNLFLLSSPSRNENTADPGTAAVTVTLSVPLDLRAEAIIDAALRCGAGDNSAITFMIVTSLVEDNSVPSLALFDLAAAGTGPGNADTISSVRKTVLTNASRQIRYRLNRSSNSNIATIFTRGWYDYFLD